MEINVNISAGSAEEVRHAMRKILGDNPASAIVVGAETTSVDPDGKPPTPGNPEPEIVAPAKKGRGKAKPKADDVTDIDTNGDPVDPPKATTEPPSLGPKHDEVRAIAREFNTKFGGDELLAVFKSLGCTGPRMIFEKGHADAFIEKAKARLEAA